MGDDIVERLRFIVPIHEGRRGHDCIAAAADEIERLRAAGAALYVLLDEMHKHVGALFADATREDDRG